MGFVLGWGGQKEGFYGLGAYMGELSRVRGGSKYHPLNSKKKFLGGGKNFLVQLGGCKAIFLQF